MKIEELMEGWRLLWVRVPVSERGGFSVPPRDERCCSTLSRLAGEPTAAGRDGAIVLSWKDDCNGGLDVVRLNLSLLKSDGRVTA